MGKLLDWSKGTYSSFCVNCIMYCSFDVSRQLEVSCRLIYAWNIFEFPFTALRITILGTILSYTGHIFRFLAV